MYLEKYFSEIHIIQGGVDILVSVWGIIEFPLGASIYHVASEGGGVLRNDHD